MLFFVSALHLQLTLPKKRDVNALFTQSPNHLVTPSPQLCVTFAAHQRLPQVKGDAMEQLMSKPLLTNALTRNAETADARLLEIGYQRYYRSIQAYLHRLCGSHEQAEDLAQETFAKASAAIHKFRGDASLRTWLFQIARNTYLDTLRRPSSVRIDTEEFLAIPDAANDNDPVSRYDASEHRDRIALALGQLPERQRSILLLRDAEELSYIEIADVLAISLAAVKVNLFRARRAFREAYAQLEASEHPGE